MVFSEKDLVDRFYRASKLFSADIIVRITADCPLADPKIIDKVIVRRGLNIFNRDEIKWDRIEAVMILNDLR